MTNLEILRVRLAYLRSMGHRLDLIAPVTFTAEETRLVRAIAAAEKVDCFRCGGTAQQYDGPCMWCNHDGKKAEVHP